MIIPLPDNTPVVQDELEEGGFYSVLVKTAGHVLIEAEVDDGDWKSIGETSGFESISALPGTKLRFTVIGAATGKVRLTQKP